MNRGCVTGALLVACVFVAVACQGAQVQSVDTSQPIVVKSSKPPNPKHDKLLGEFVSATSGTLTVRDRNNTYVIRTFSYTPQVSAKMVRIAAQGGYHYGDKVEIEYAVGSDVALNVKGKPSSSTSH